MSSNSKQKTKFRMKRNNFYNLILERASDSTSTSNKPTPKKTFKEDLEHVIVVRDLGDS